MQSSNRTRQRKQNQTKRFVCLAFLVPFPGAFIFVAMHQLAHLSILEQGTYVMGHSTVIGVH
ncbi:unnamed protein product [Ixodes pacificus]